MAIVEVDCGHGLAEVDYYSDVAMALTSVFVWALLLPPRGELAHGPTKTVMGMVMAIAVVMVMVMGMVMGMGMMMGMVMVKVMVMMVVMVMVMVMVGLIVIVIVRL